MPRPWQKICAGKSRQHGGPCGYVAQKGSDYCKFHGARTPFQKGNLYSAKPGAMYSKFLSDEAKNAIKDQEIGTLEDQILFMRGKIYDIMKLKEQQDADPEKLDIEGRSVTDSDNGSSVTVTYRKRDYDKALLDAIKQLESLEKTHAALVAEKAKNDSTIHIEGGLPEVE